MPDPTPTDLIGRDPATGRPLRVTVDGGLITAVEFADADAPSDPPWLTPGLIDLQVNGFGGFDANAVDASPDDVGAMVRALLPHGVTTALPTIITASEDDIRRALTRIVASRRVDPESRHAISAIHVEGPHMSDQDGPRGVHPLEHIRPPDPAEFDRWQEAAEGLIGIVTLSPHWDGSAEYVAHLTAAGVSVSIGHTHAEPEQIAAAVDAGAVLSTHLGNGAHARIARHPNYIWRQLADDRLSAGFIADGHHLPPDTLLSMLRAKRVTPIIGTPAAPGPDAASDLGAFLVSDATALAGLPAGRYRTPVGGEVELSEDGRLSEVGTPYLAGAARSLREGVANAAALPTIGLARAVELATTSPARYCTAPATVDLPSRGRLTVGASADLVTFDWRPGDVTLTIRQVLVAGRQVAPSVET